ncbi:hypothetical protein IRT45_34920 [Nocardia sp. BSTN01]|uniref:hypothetical protein n=1 Tax=Nocardia sp. BSTN01 TaxID=2783665 RepID=UPI00188DCA35|nr:hypothetical protein [Nocardia sp. BSTN01]MBF5002313.1 hypothetical protein [Nocardia sp. BSTN01]
MDDHALRDQELGISATHVWVDQGGEMVIGYFTLTPTRVSETEGAPLWKRLKPKQFWASEVYGILIAKIALDQSLRGAGRSVDLFGDAIYLAIEAMRTIGGVYVVIDPMDNRPRLRSLYEGYGFETVEGTDRMYMRVDDFCDGGVPI